MDNKKGCYTNVFRYKISLSYGNNDGWVKMSSEDIGLLYKSEDKKTTAFKFFDKVLSNQHCHITFNENKVILENFCLVYDNLRLNNTLRTPFLKADRYFSQQFGYTVVNSLCDINNGIVRLDILVDTEFARCEHIGLKIKIKELFEYNEFD